MISVTPSPIYPIFDESYLFEFGKSIVPKVSLLLSRRGGRVLQSWIAHHDWVLKNIDDVPDL